MLKQSVVCARAVLGTTRVLVCGVMHELKHSVPFSVVLVFSTCKFGAKKSELDLLEAFPG